MLDDETTKILIYVAGLFSGYLLCWGMSCIDEHSRNNNKAGD